MSNAVTYDPLLAHYLADELNERLRGRGCAAAPIFAPDRSVTLPFEGGELLRADLHPTRGWIRILPSPTPELEPTPGTACGGVTAPTDERILRLEIMSADRFRSQRRFLVLELHTNQWNAIVHDEDGRILNVLRGRRAGSRALFPGQVYEPPAAAPRFGASEVDRGDALREWREHVGTAPEEQRRARLIARFAWTGSLNASWILEPFAAGADAGGTLTDPVDGSFERWWWLRGLPDPRPCVVTIAGRSQPYPLRLEGLPAGDAPSLLSAMSMIADESGEEVATPAPDDAASARSLVEARLREARRKVEGLQRELEAAEEESVRLRSWADLLLARMAEVPRGRSSVTLEDWSGEPTEIALDPSATVTQNAAALYERARRRERAREQLPGLIDAATREVERWESAAGSLDRDQMPDWLPGEIERIRSARPVERSRREPGESTSYRTFRTSGGLEVRVARNARDGDRLTFRDSSPNDIWLHARSVPGAHVILRWKHADQAPPARDLAEAAQLAAVHSRARTSSTVAVDWTRRRYVRKPRGAAPGLVIPQRVKTLFVEPDAEIVARLADGGDRSEMSEGPARA